MLDDGLKLEAAVELLCQAHEHNRPLTPAQLATVRAPSTAQEAYWIQDAVMARLPRWNRERVNAWKVGAPSSESTPIAAPIPAVEVYASEVRLAGDDFYVIGIEAELAFEFSRDFPDREKPYSDEEVWAGILRVQTAIEVVNTRLENWDQAGPWWKLADNQLNGALVLGSGIDDWQQIDSQNQTVELWVDGNKKLSRMGSHPLGDPLPLIPWLVNHCMSRNGGLRAGDLVTTGTWTGMEFVSPGSSVRACFPGVGEVSVELTG